MRNQHRHFDVFQYRSSGNSGRDMVDAKRASSGGIGVL